jgi:hypothetical protein
MMDDDEEEHERRRKILDEARATVERTKDIGQPSKRKQRDETAALPPDELAKTLIGVESRAERWERRANERERQREQAKAEIASARCADWADIDARIEAHLVPERKFISEAMGIAIGQLLDDERDAVMRAHREEIRELKIEVAKLGSEVAELRALLATERSTRAASADASLLRRVN